ncbi:MAG: response regulator [Candidatus Tectimicrobiota bacterium]
MPGQQLMTYYHRLCRSSASIRLRLFVLLGGVSLSTLLVVNLVWLPGAIYDIQAAQTELQRVAVRGVRDQIHFFLEDKERALTDQARRIHTFLAKQDQDSLRLLAQRFLQHESAFVEFGILDAQGQERLKIARLKAVTPRDLGDASASPMFQAAQQHQTYWGAVITTETSEPWITLAIPMKEAGTTLTGVVYGVINLKALWEVASALRLRHGGRAYVVDQEGRLIAADEPNLVLKRLTFGARPLLQQLRQRPASDTLEFVHGDYHNEYGVQVIATGLMLPTTQWSVVVEQPWATLYAPIARKLWFAAGFSICGMLLCLGGTHVLSRRFTQPILRLREGVVEFGRGNLTYLMPVETPDEIGELAQQCNLMASQLRDSYAALERQITDKARNLNALYVLTSPLQQTHDMQQVLDDTVARLTEVLGVQATAIALLDETQQQISLTATQGLPRAALASGDALWLEALTHHALARRGDPVIVDKLLDDVTCPFACLQQAGFHSAAAVLLQTPQRPLGLLLLASGAPEYCNSQHRDLLRALAHQISVTIENTQLYAASAAARACAEEAVRGMGASEARLTAVIASAMDAIITLDQAQRIMLFNTAAEQMFRCTAAEVLGQPIERFLPDRCAAHRGYLHHFATLSESNRLMGTLGRLSGVRMDGEEFPMEVSISKAEASGQLFYTVIIRDMTEQRQAEQVRQEQTALAALEAEIGTAMARSESPQEMLGHCTVAMVRHLEAAFARIWTLNDADQILELQASAGLYSHLTGAHARIPVGQFKIGLIAQERQPHLSNSVTTDPRVGDPEWARREGLVAFAGYPLLAGDRLVGVIAMFARQALSPFVLQGLGSIATTIALGLERLQARQALRESELRFRQLTEHLHEVFYLFEIESTRMLYISPAYQQIWGRSAQSLYEHAMDFVAAVHPDDQASVHAMLAQHARGEDTSIEYRIVRPDGEVRWILDRAFPFQDPAQGVHRVAGVAEDITERKQATEALREINEVLEQRVTERTAALSMANTALAQATRLKDEFLASMSHELRTPLNAILGLSEALQEQVYGPLTDKQSQSLHRIEESGRHLLALITDILDLSKIEAGKVTLQLTPVDVEGLCQASLRLLRESAEKKQLRLTATVSPSVQAQALLADERRLKQMLVNLLSNAVKFTPPEGSIGLDVSGSAAEAMVSFTVWDTGVGIAEADKARLFQPFVQLDSSLARHHAGTGLGLSLVARLAALHGGRVMLESTVGQGSRFSVLLPWRLASQEQTAGLHLPETPLAPPGALDGLECVMIVEDTPTHAEQLVRYLKELAVNVTVYPRGEGAVEYAETTRPDVILLDLGLPHVSGWDVLEQLKSAPTTCTIPVVITSVIDEQTQGLTRGAAAYLVKPISRVQLQHALYQASATRQRPQPRQPSALPDAVVDDSPLLLLAEDNEANVTATVEYLRTKGYRLAVASNGTEALAYARTLYPALIVMDIQMPGMDGLEATRCLRAESDARLARIPIIALTALAMPGDRERCLAAGANAYLSKPVRFKELLRTIEMQLKGYTGW